MAFPPVQAAPPAIPATGAPVGPPNVPNALQGWYTTPSGIPALPRPQLQMSETDVKLWWGRIVKDRARRDLEKPNWEMLNRAYNPPSYGADYTDLNSNIHFRNHRIKTAALWTQPPTLILTPLEPLKGIPQLDLNGHVVINPQTQQPQMASPDDVVAINGEILNKLLGRDGANVTLTAKQCLFDYEQTSGIGPSKICYESDVKYVPPTPAVEQPGNVLKLNQPIEPHPVVVNERWRWYHFSPEKLGIPTGFLSTDWDAAPYLFMEFEEPFTEQAKRAYHLPNDYRPTNATSDRPLSSDADRASAATVKVIKGVEVWLHAAEYDPNEADKDVFYRLVLIEGLKDRAAVYELSPYQDKGENGRLTPDSMIGNPIHPMALRVGGETAWVKSDAAFTNPLVNIENIQEQEDALIREANVPRFLHATSLSDGIDKLRNAGTGQGIAVDDSLMVRIAQLIYPLPHLERAQSDNQGRDRNDRRITETLGLGANQAGSFSETHKSATEVATVQANVSGPLQAERIELMEWYLRGVRKMDALKMRYMTDAGYVQIVGQDGRNKLMAYNKAHVSPRFGYDAHPDSQISVDQATRIKRVTDFENFYAKSPAADQWGMFRRGCIEFGYPVAEMLKPPPTTAPPPPMSMSIDLSSANLAENLLLPEVRTILQTHGVPLQPQPSPEAVTVAAAQRAKENAIHGGGAPQADKVEKHAAQESGNQVGAHPLAGAPAQTPPPAVPRMVQ